MPCPQFAPSFLRENQIVIDYQKVLCFLLIVVNVVRFYHGNIRLLDDTYMYDTDAGRRGGCSARDRHTWIGLDFTAVFSMSLAFALQGFLYNFFRHIYVNILSCLLIDIVWHFASFAVGASKEAERSA